MCSNFQRDSLSSYYVEAHANGKRMPVSYHQATLLLNARKAFQVIADEGLVILRLVPNA